MNPERWQQIDQLFRSALKREPGERPAFLNQACAGDSKLRERIEDLLAAHDEANSFIESPTIEVEARMPEEKQSKRAADSIVGQTIGHYRIIAPLGLGGMGEVYLAQDTALGRRVALKMLPAVFIKDVDRLRRFEQEARTTSALNHPNIVTIYEIGHTESQHFISTEFIDGLTLRQHIVEHQLKLSEVLDISIQIASALTAAHAKGIVHRDIKPENVMVLKDKYSAEHERRIKVLDFGIAKLTERPTARVDPDGTTKMLVKTEEGVAIGTVSYMSPEQVRGGPLDTRTDIWSLGVVVFEMLTGALPFKGDSVAETMAAILKEEPEGLVETNGKINPALAKIVSRCLAKEPDLRFQSASDLGFALESLSVVSSVAKPELPNEKASRTTRIRPAWWIAAAFLILAAAALTFVFSLRNLGSTSNQVTFTAVTYRPMAIFKAAFAPDGKTIVFSAAPEGNTTRLFVIRPEYPGPQPIGEPGTHLLAVSTKGELAVLTSAQYIAQRFFTGTLARMPLGGGAPREILENVREADWAPDATQVAIIREVAGKDRLEFPMGNVLYESAGWVSDLRFSHGGDRIAFFEHPWRWDDRGSVNVIDLHGKKTTLSGGYWGEEGISWSRDDKEILFSASFKNPQWTIFAVTLTGERRVALQSPGGQTIHDVSTDGRWLTSRDEQTWRVMVHTPAWEGDRDFSWLDTSNFPILSQDGRILVFMEQNVGPNYAVCLRKTEGGDVVRLGDGVPWDLSADGGKVLAVIPSAPPQIVIYPTGAGEPQRLDRNGLENYSGDGRWFPDGLRVLLGANEPGKAPRYYVQDLAGGPPQAVTPEGTREGVLSRDGTFVLAKGPDSRYHVYPLAGGEARLIAGLTTDDRLVRMSADGRSVLAASHSEVPLRAEHVDLETGRRTLIKEIAPVDRVGLREIFLTFVSNDQRSYAYWTSWFRSTMFTVEWER